MLTGRFLKLCYNTQWTLSITDSNSVDFRSKGKISGQTVPPATKTSADDDLRISVRERGRKRIIGMHACVCACVCIYLVWFTGGEQHSCCLVLISTVVQLCLELMHRELLIYATVVYAVFK